MSEPVPFDRPRRRRRTSSRNAPRTLRDRADRLVRGGWMTRVMLLAFAGYVGLSAVQISTRINWYAYVGLGDEPAAVIYALGRPNSRTGAEWRYIAGGRVVTVPFADGRVSRLACRGTAGLCPDMMELLDGSGEEEVLTRLGTPEETRFVDGDKVIAYRSLGLSFQLHQFVVRSIALSDSRASVSAPLRYARIMLP